MINPTTSWGPHDSEFNGMVQLVVAPEELRDRMRKEGPCLLVKENALTEEQSWHHITLAYKPTCGEVEKLVEWFSNEHCTCTFHPQEVRASPGICAVFGSLTRRGDDGEWDVPWFSKLSYDALSRRTTTRGSYNGSWHITIGADEGVQPKESNKLLDDYATCTAWERYPDMPQVFGLYLNVVDFD